MIKLDWKKVNGLIPAIIQDHKSLQVLMLGYMNKDSYKKTLETKKVTFFSRSRQCLWTKGETSGNFFFQIGHFDMLPERDSHQKPCVLHLVFFQFCLRAEILILL